MAQLLHILSLGASVQSPALLLISIRAMPTRFDAAIFAYTGWEPPEVYGHLDWLAARARSAGIPP
jgi:hypothetical protein